LIIDEFENALGFGSTNDISGGQFFLFAVFFFFGTSSVARSLSELATSSGTSLPESSSPVEAVLIL
jgi:hypothetical protein